MKQGTMVPGMSPSGYLLPGLTTINQTGDKEINNVLSLRQRWSDYSENMVMVPRRDRTITQFTVRKGMKNRHTLQAISLRDYLGTDQFQMVSLKNISIWWNLVENFDTIDFALIMFPHKIELTQRKETMQVNSFDNYRFDNGA